MSVYCLSPHAMSRAAVVRTVAALALAAAVHLHRQRRRRNLHPPSISDVEEDVEALFQKFYLRGTTPFSRRSREEKSQDARRCYRAALLERCRSAGQRLCQARTVGWRVAAYSPPASTSRRAIVRARERGAMTQQLIKDWAKGARSKFSLRRYPPQRSAVLLSTRCSLGLSPRDLPRA